MINIRYTILTFIVLMMINGCIEPLEISYDENPFDLVVDGKLTQGNTPQVLYLSRTTGSGYYKRNHVEGAQITLYDSMGNFEYYFEDSENEYYRLYGDRITREPGESYYIEIQLRNNKIYLSRPQIMPDIMEADTVIARPEIVERLNDEGNLIRNSYVSVYLNTPIKKSQKDFYYIWRSNEAYSFTEIQCHPLHTPKICYVKRPIKTDEIKIYSSEDLDEGMLTDFLVARVDAFPLWEHYEKRFYNTAQHSITREAYEYWATVKIIAQPTGSIFDVPPAPIPGNVYNPNDPEEKVYGFFEVSAVDTVRTRTFWHDLEPLAIIDRCPRLNWQTYNDPPCCQCLHLLNSDTERPYYWGE